MRRADSSHAVLPHRRTRGFIARRDAQTCRCEWPFARVLSDRHDCRFALSDAASRARTRRVASYVARASSPDRRTPAWSHSCSFLYRSLTNDLLTKETMDKRAIRSVSVGVFLFVALLAGVASAQQATIVGTVTDESKAVLPGVTVTVSDMAKGTQVVAVTDARGE